MTDHTPSAGAAPALPREITKREIQALHHDAMTLANVLHIADHFDPIDAKAAAALTSLGEVAAQMAEKLATDLEEHL